MATVDIRRIIRNYLPIPYRIKTGKGDPNVIESLIYALLSSMEGINDLLTEAINEFRYTISDPEVYSLDVVIFKIRELYGLEFRAMDPDASRIIITDAGAQINIRFGVNYTTDNNFHLNRIRPLIPAGIGIEITYDT